MSGTDLAYAATRLSGGLASPHTHPLCPRPLSGDAPSLSYRATRICGMLRRIGACLTLRCGMLLRPLWYWQRHAPSRMILRPLALRSSEPRRRSPPADGPPHAPGPSRRPPPSPRGCAAYKHSSTLKSEMEISVRTRGRQEMCGTDVRGGAMLLPGADPCEARQVPQEERARLNQLWVVAALPACGCTTVRSALSERGEAR
eukprot:1548206-Rhodomonas_salina.2